MIRVELRMKTFLFWLVVQEVEAGEGGSDGEQEQQLQVRHPRAFRQHYNRNQTDRLELVMLKRSFILFATIFFVI